MTTCEKRSANGARCQPPPPGVRDLQLDRLLDELLATALPPRALVHRMVAAKRHLLRLGQHAEQLQALARPSCGLIEATSMMAATTPGHDPYDTDELLADDVAMLDEVAALGMLLRGAHGAGVALDLATTGIVIDDDPSWAEHHQRQAETVAGAVLLAARRNRQ